MRCLKEDSIYADTNMLTLIVLVQNDIGVGVKVTLISSVYKKLFHKQGPGSYILDHFASFGCVNYM